MINHKQKIVISIAIALNILTLTSCLPRQAHSITLQSDDHPRFIVKVLHVYTKDLEVKITLHHITKTASVFKGSSSTNPINRTIALDFGTIPHVHIGDSYYMCIGTTHIPEILCTYENITSLPIQHTQIDVTDLPE